MASLSHGHTFSPLLVISHPGHLDSSLPCSTHLAPPRPTAPPAETKTYLPWTWRAVLAWWARLSFAAIEMRPGESYVPSATSPLGRRYRDGHSLWQRWECRCSDWKGHHPSNFCWGKWHPRQSWQMTRQVLHQLSDGRDLGCAHLLPRATQWGGEGGSRGKESPHEPVCTHAETASQLGLGMTTPGSLQRSGSGLCDFGPRAFPLLRPSRMLCEGQGTIANALGVGKQFQGVTSCSGNSGRVAARTYQLLQLPLPVAQLFVHALAHICALQRGDDLQLGVIVVDDVVFQHQA